MRVLFEISSLFARFSYSTLVFSANYNNNRAVVLEKVCKYLYYNVRHTNTTQEVPGFKIEPEIALELLMAADFLDC